MANKQTETIYDVPNIGEQSATPIPRLPLSRERRLNSIERPMLRQIIAPLHPDGWKFVAIGVVATVILYLLWHPAGWLALIVTLWVAYFFRDPWRVTPTRSGLVVSPADGIVVSLAPAPPPVELDMGSAPVTRIGIFRNLFDLHVARAPAAG